MGIIFDLDQTLVNSSIAEKHRKNREWNKVYSLIHKLSPYEGINELLNELSKNSVPFGIVTSSPLPYCNRIIKHWDWNVSFTVCYHDTKRRKPHPDPIELGIKKLGLVKDDIISIGDHANDIIASKKLGILTAGALWGNEDNTSLIASKPDFLFDDSNDMIQFLKKKYIEKNLF